jgi:small subunit ribosomal protein S17
MSEARKSMMGRVISTKMDKTVVVEVEYRVRHPLYRKIVRQRRRFMAHDEAKSCQEGDRVRIVETRPLSRMKRWRVVEIVERAE